MEADVSDRFKTLWVRIDQHSAGLAQIDKHQAVLASQLENHVDVCTQRWETSIAAAAAKHAEQMQAISALYSRWWMLAVGVIALLLGLLRDLLFN